MRAVITGVIIVGSLIAIAAVGWWPVSAAILTLMLVSGYFAERTATRNRRVDDYLTAQRWKFLAEIWRLPPPTQTELDHAELLLMEWSARAAATTGKIDRRICLSTADAYKQALVIMRRKLL